MADLVRELSRLPVPAQRPRELAVLRMLLARDEGSEESAARFELAATAGAALGRKRRKVVRLTDQRFDVSALHRLFERTVEVAEHHTPVDVAFLDLIEI